MLIANTRTVKSQKSWLTRILFAHMLKSLSEKGEVVTWGRGDGDEESA